MNKLIRFDWAIKYILKHKANFDILEGFLSELLKTDIKIKSILDGESNKETAEDKSNRVDLLVETGNNEKIIIEVQCQSQLDYLSRILYGTSKVLTEHIHQGEKYRTVSKILSISIVFFNLGEGKDYIYKGRTDFTGIHYHDRLRLAPNEQEIYKSNRVKNSDLEPNDIFPEYYIIKVNQFKERIKDKFDEWVYFLKNESIKPDFAAKGIRSAAKKLDVLSLNEKERAAYEDYLQDKMYEASMIDSHYGLGKRKGEAIGFKKGKIEGLKDGREEGVKEGIEKGIEKGIVRGREEGVKEGIKEGTKNIAINLLNLGQDTDIIAKATGLSVADIQKIRAELQPKPANLTP